MKYKISSSSFIAASDTFEKLPSANGPEVCVLGRSNVGKSSLINKLLSRRDLARVGKTPGSTKLICMYEVLFSENRSNAKKMKRGVLSDLPGFGYAKTSNVNRISWSKLLTSYLQERESLKLVILLVDVRRDLGKEEKEIIEVGKEGGLAIAITKADKVTKNELTKRKQYFQKETGLPDEAIFVTSSESATYKAGMESLRDLICSFFLPE